MMLVGLELITYVYFHVNLVMKFSLIGERRN